MINEKKRNERMKSSVERPSSYALHLMNPCKHKAIYKNFLRWKYKKHLKTLKLPNYCLITTSKSFVQIQFSFFQASRIAQLLCIIEIIPNLLL